MQRCYSCMQEFEKEYELCPHCGFVVGTPPIMVNHLPYGTRLQDRYIIGKALGHGGFGITYIAWDDKDRCIVAIKEFFPHSLSMRNQGEKEVYCYVEESSRYFNDGIRKMMDEGKRLSRFIENENIVDVYDFFEENNTAYIVMEYLEGRDLKKYLDEVGGKLEPQAAIRIMLPILNALADMHSDNLIHRDIAPDNIFICDDGRIKLLDFGSARLAVQDADRSLSVLIKAGYAPKEQYLSRSKQGPWTDVYAACATLYRIVTGEIPVSSTERDTVPLKSFKQFGLYGHDALEEVISKGLEPEIENRTKYAQLLEKELKAVFKSYSGDFSEINQRVNRATKSRLRRKNKRKLKIAGIVAGAVAVLVAAVAGIVAIVNNSGKKEASYYEDSLAAVEEEIVTEAVDNAKDTVIIRIGKKNRTQLLNSIFANAEKIFMVDIDSDGKSEIFTLNDRFNLYSNLSDGSLKNLSVDCPENAELFFDKADKTVVCLDEIGEYKAYRLNGDVFELNSSLTGDDINEMVNAEVLIKASELQESGICGEKTNWTYFKEESLLYISGTGENFVFPQEMFETPWSEYRQEVEKVIINDDMRSVPSDLCFLFGALSEVYLGSSVEKIGDNAFASCDSLTNIVIPESVTEIGAKAFSSTAITEIAIGPAVSFIGENAFYDCKALKKIYVDGENLAYASDSEGVLYSKDYTELITYPAGSPVNFYHMLPSTVIVYKNAFANSTRLSGVYFAEGVTQVGDGVFSGCAVLESAELSQSLEAISNSMFENCGELIQIQIPENAEKIGDKAFANCKKLNSIKFPSGMKYIGESAFLNCTGIEEMVLSQAVLYIGAEAFSGWKSNQKISVDSSRITVSANWNGQWQSGCDAEVVFKRLI